jgi:hypothetical protein
MTQKADITWRRAPSVAFVDDGERVVLLELSRLATAQPQMLNGVGSRIWRMLAEQRTFSELVASLTPPGLKTPPDVVHELHVFLELMYERGLCEPISSATGD